MTLKLTRRGRLVTVDGVICREWEGETEDGDPFVAFILAIAVPDDAGADVHAKFGELCEERGEPELRIVVAAVGKG